MTPITKRTAAALLLGTLASAGSSALAADKAPKKPEPQHQVANAEEERAKALERYTAESQKALEICTRDNFGKACTAAQARVEQLRLRLEKLNPDDGYGIGRAPLGK